MGKFTRRACCLGVSPPSVRLYGISANHGHSINKLVGESFKLHAQALSGYEDPHLSNTGPGTGTPTMSSIGVEPELETAY